MRHVPNRRLFAALVLFALAAVAPAPARQASEDEALAAQRKGGGRQALVAVSPTEFLFQDNPSRLVVVKDARSRVTGLRIESRIGPAQIFSRTDRPLPSPRKEAAVDPKLYDPLAGEYELNPGFTITILRRGDKLISQATGQPEVELFPESETRFFLKVVDAQVDFVKDEAGRVTGLVLHQGGLDLPARRIRRP
jgi:hypothetical protein